MNKGVMFVLVLIVILLCGAVGYYLIDSKVDLKDNSVDVKADKWCIKLSDLSKPKLSGDATSSNSKIVKNVLNFDAIFNKKDDEVEYDMTVKNCGTVNAYFFSSMIDGIEADEEDNLSYIIDGIEEKDILKAGDSVNIKVKVSSKIEEKQEYSLSVKLNFSQAD